MSTLKTICIPDQIERVLVARILHDILYRRSNAAPQSIDHEESFPPLAAGPQTPQSIGGIGYNSALHLRSPPLFLRAPLFDLLLTSSLPN